MARIARMEEGEGMAWRLKPVVWTAQSTVPTSGSTDFRGVEVADVLVEG